MTRVRSRGLLGDEVPKVRVAETTPMGHLGWPAIHSFIIIFFFILPFLFIFFLNKGILGSSSPKNLCDARGPFFVREAGSG